MPLRNSEHTVTNGANGKAPGDPGSEKWRQEAQRKAKDGFLTAQAARPRGTDGENKFYQDRNDGILLQVLTKVSSLD